MRKGDLIAGRYLLQRELGSGTFGRIFSAIDRRTKSIVAMKFQDPRSFESTYTFKLNRRDYTREARLLKEFSGTPGIPRHIAKVRHNGAWCIVMELIDGQTIKKYTESGNRPMPQDAAVAIIVQLAACVAQLHRRGLVHRDLKPENAMIDLGGDVHLIDFGSACSTARTPSLAHGTAGYAAPEQARRGRIGPSADIFALGCMFSEMLTLNLPYGTEYFKHVHDPLGPTPSPNLSNLSPSLMQVISDTIRWDPTQRTQSALELIEQLQSFLPEIGAAKDPRILGPDPTARFRNPAVRTW